MIDEYADSTIAMSIYNVLATTGGPMNDLMVFNHVRTTANPGVTKKQFDASLNKLGKMKLIRRTPLGIAAVDPKRRIIVSRDRSDMKKQVDGRVTGGWGGWMWKDPAGTISRVFRKQKGATK